MIQYIFRLDTMNKKFIARQIVGFAVVKALFLLFFATNSFSNAAYAQTNKAKNTEQKQQLMLQIEKNVASFLFSVKAKCEQAQFQKNTLEAELASLYAKKKKKKTEIEKQIERIIQQKIVYLEKRIQEYQSIENEIIEIQSVMKNLISLVTNSKAKNTIQNQQKQINQSVIDENNIVLIQEYIPTQYHCQTSDNQFIDTGNLILVYYLILGSFAKINEAEKFQSKLKKHYPNAVNIGNENIYGMYRVGIGPYTTKEEAMAQKSSYTDSWVLPKQLF